MKNITVTGKIIILVFLISLCISGVFLLEGNPKLVNRINSKIQNLIRFSRAQIAPSQLIGDKLSKENEELKTPNLIEGKEVEKEGESELEFTLATIQERLDDVSEKIDILTQKVEELRGSEKVEEISREPEKKDIEKPEEELKEKELEVEEKEVGQETVEKIIISCFKIPGSYPIRNKIIINEVAWMGNTNSANDEWIELKNISQETIHLSNWQLKNKDGQIKIDFKESDLIPAAGFYLLERTNDDSVQGVKADLIYTGAILNSEESLYLFDGNCQLQDEVESNPNWPGGDNFAKRTMERKSDLNWQNSLDIFGTPKMENSSGYYETYISGGGSISPPSQSMPVIFYPKILINEIQIDGKKSEKEDFVELFNPSSEDIDLTDWYLQRMTKSGDDFLSYASKNLFSGKIIKAKNYFLIVNNSFEILNDATTTYPLTKDNALFLKNPRGEIVDKVGWGNARDFETATTTNPEAGQSIGRKWSSSTESYTDTDNNKDDFQVQDSTPKEKNREKREEPLNQIPIAAFTFSTSTSFFTSDEILFDASFSTDTDGTIAAYIFDFGDNNSTTTNQTTITHFFTTSSDFLITLLVVDNLGATSSPATVTINIKFPPQPILELAATTLNFRGEKDESIPNQTIIIKNAGQGELNWNSSIIYASSSSAWLLLNQATGTTLESESLTLEFSINTSGLAVGNYIATATIEAAMAQNSPQDISISLTIFPKTVKTVIINEIAWMGTEADYHDEWIELYNNSISTINLTGWSLISADGNPNILFSTSSIPAKDYFLLERTASTTIFDIEEDKIYTGSLNDGGERLELRDNNNNLIDLVDCSLGWFAGKKDEKISMERIDPNLPGSYSDSWADNNTITKNGLDATENTINGTPKSKNSVSL